MASSPEPTFATFLSMIYSRKVVVLASIVVWILVTFLYMSMRDDRFVFESVVEVGTVSHGFVATPIEDINDLLQIVNNSFIPAAYDIQVVSKEELINLCGIRAHSSGKDSRIIVLEGLAIERYSEQCLKVLQRVTADILKRLSMLFDVREKEITAKREGAVIKKEQLESELNFLESVIARVIDNEIITRESIKEMEKSVKNMNAHRRTIEGEIGKDTYDLRLLAIDSEINLALKRLYRLKKMLNDDAQGSRSSHVLDKLSRENFLKKINSQLMQLDSDEKLFSRTSILTEPDKRLDGNRRSPVVIIILSVIAGIMSGVILILFSDLIRAKTD